MTTPLLAVPDLPVLPTIRQVLAGEAAWRIGGFMSKVEEVLNVDGYQVIRYDRSAKQVHLNVGLLDQLFEVKL